MIRISLFGSLKIRAGDGRTADLRTRRSGELFALLLLTDGGTFSRAELAELFWPHLPGERGRRALSTELWRLAQGLREIGMDIDRALLHGVGDIGYVAQPDTVVDVDTLKSAMRVVRSTEPAEADQDDLTIVEAGVAAYRGDLLETVYSDWCLLLRENLRAQYTEALEFLLTATMERLDWIAALRHGRALLTIDPFMEHVHRAVMHCHARNGDRPLALRQYVVCEQVLRRELDAEPMDETRQLFETLLTMPARLDDRPAPTPNPLRVPIGTPAQKIGLALAEMKAARLWIERVAGDLRRSAGG